MQVTGNSLYPQNSIISIQVSLSGYSFITNEGGHIKSSGILGHDRVFTTPEFLRRYDCVQIALMTPKFALVPSQFFNPTALRSALSDVVSLGESDSVDYVEVPEHNSVLVFSNSIGESLSSTISNTALTSGGESVKVLPEMYYLLKSMSDCKEYNKILASYADGYLHLAISQGKSLQLCNSYKAPDFTTAEYFIFLAMKKLQLNPEMSTITFRTPLSNEQEMSLYRYFRAVEQI